MKPIPTDISNYISYDKESGILTRIADCRADRPTILGEITSKDSLGYIRFQFRSSRYKGHRVAWFLATGEQPQIIDHIDGNPLNNKLSNLRSTSFIVNNRNKIMHRNGATPGVTFHKRHKKWQVRIKGKYGGMFLTEKEAVEYIKKEGGTK